MKKHLLKNIIKFTCIFSISAVCSGIFSQKVFGFRLDTAFSDSRRSVYNSMSNQGKQELSNFYEILEVSVRQRHHNNHAIADFENFLKQVNAFLNTSNDREKKAYILGIFPLEGGYYIINTRHLNFFTSKCKSSINASFQRLGFNTVSFDSISRPEVQNFLNSFNRVNCDARKRWTCRIRPRAINNFVQNLVPMNILNSVQNPMVMNMSLNVPNNATANNFVQNQVPMNIATNMPNNSASVMGISNLVQNPALTNIPNIIQQPERSNNDSATITDNVAEDNTPAEFSFDNVFGDLSFEDDNFSNWF